MKSRDPNDDEIEASGSRAVRGLAGAAASALLIWAVWRWPLVMLGVAALVLILVMHELGHYVTARATGMKVTDFFLGFGPRLWSFTRGETTYGLRALPLGAYVRIVGMYRDDPVPPEDESQTYRSKSYPRRALVISAGSIMHMLLALAAFMSAHMFLGVPVVEDDRWEVDEVVAARDGVAMPAAAAGLAPGGRIVSVDGVPTEEWPDFVRQVQQRPEQQARLEIVRDDEVLDAYVTLATNPSDGTGLLGVTAQPHVVYVTADPAASLFHSFADLWHTIRGSAASLWTLLANLGELADRIWSPPGDPSSNADLSTRPVSVVGMVHVASGSGVGWSERLMLFALVNVFLGVFNMAPVPPLDGGHLAVATYERLRERRGGDRHLIDPKPLAVITNLVITLMLVLALGVLYLDIANPISL